MNLIEIHQLLALRAVEHGDDSYSLRVIFRWYSKTFHVPLPQVDDLPLEDILQAYFESRYEELEADAREEIIREMVMSAEEKAAILAAKEAEKASDDDFEREAEMEAKGGLMGAMGRLASVLEKLPPPAEEESVPQIKLEPETIFEFSDDDEPFI